MTVRRAVLLLPVAVREGLGSRCGVDVWVGIAGLIHAVAGADRVFKR